MAGRTKRGPGRPRNSDTAFSPIRCIPPASPLTPDSEEGFIMTEPRATRTRGRHKAPTPPVKKTRVNAQSKLKSPIRAAGGGACMDLPRRETDSLYDHSSFRESSTYVDAVPMLPQSDLQEEFMLKDKLCAFCNCGPERRMFQGKLQCCTPTPGFNPFKKAAQGNRQLQNSPPESVDSEPTDMGKEAIDDVPLPQPMVHRRGPGRPPGRGRKKGSVVIGLPLRNSSQNMTPDKYTFGTVKEREVHEAFESDGSVWAHHCCASWSEGVCQTDSYDLVNVDKAVYQAMTERCAHCSRFGASVVCQIPKCDKTYHYPCAASAGAFQEIHSMTMLCPDHLEDAGRLGGVESQCYLCGEAKAIAEMLFCTSCGRHYHGRCLDPAVDITSLVRMGWQCPDCKVCQGCRQPGDDNKMLVCDICDRGYHTYCLEPPMTTIPKTGWKCLGCRRCEDCGSNTPGGGPTSRWHRNYTVCDSCYQQRNKGLFCPLCGRAYRQLSDVAMVKCEICEKWLHAECDNVDPHTFKNIDSKSVPYHCPSCRVKKHPGMVNEHDFPYGDSQMHEVDPVMPQNSEEDKRTLTSAALGRITPSPMDDDLPLLHSSLENNLEDMNPLRTFGDSLMDSEMAMHALDDEMEVVGKSEIDIFGPPSVLPESPPHSDNTHDDKMFVGASIRYTTTPPKTGGKRKLGPRLKSKTTGTPSRKKAKHGRPGRPPTKFKKQNSIQPSPGKENVPGVANFAEQPAKEEAEGLHSTVVLFSADDQFTTKQDMCLCCGSFGKGREGQLIVCSQCGQCYHPYCVGVKANKVILSKGWRCLDCTLCEGCGKGSDEARLLLCDNCDISYHTYCLDPPLEKVPPGGWKCKWCVLCDDCGTTTPGLLCEWQTNYTQCGPCASKVTCPVCNIKYNINDLMIQCLHCNRWLHGSCDGLMTEDEVDKAAEYGYHCLFCRPKTKRAVVTLSGPPSPRATALHHYRPQFSTEAHPPQPQAKPIHPCQRLTNNGLVELKLANHIGYGSLGTQQPSVDNIFLTDSGIKQMSRLKLSPSRRKVKVKNKFKPKKFGLGSPCSPTKKAVLSPVDDDQYDAGQFDDNAVDYSSKGADCTSKGARQKNSFRPGVGGFLVRGRGAAARRFGGRGSRGPRRKGFNQVFNRGRLQGSLARQQHSIDAVMDSNDTWCDDKDKLTSASLREAYPIWMQDAFFGKSLLHGNTKRRKPKHEAGSMAVPLGDNKHTIAPFNRQPSSDLPIDDHTQISQDQTSWPSGNSAAGLPTDALPLPDDFPNPDALYRSLDMLSAEVIPLAAQDEHQHEPSMHQQQTRPANGPPQPERSASHAGGVQPQTTDSLMHQHPRQTQGNDLDFLPSELEILPHVDGQEVEDIFAGIEMEMNNRDSSFVGMESVNQIQPPPHSQQMARPSSDIPGPVGYSSGHSDMGSYHQGPRGPGFDRSLPHHFDPVPPIYNQFGQEPGSYPARPNSRVHGLGPLGQFGFDNDPGFPKNHDFDLASDLPRERRRPPSPRADPMKQQQKWQEDEKLGATATISPVLYANLEHPNLSKEYPEWTNRYRAIARLWRKLTVEQREPFRLKARDNRVRLKDQEKRLIRQKEEKTTTSTPPSTLTSLSQPEMKADTQAQHIQIQDPFVQNEVQQDMSVAPIQPPIDEQSHKPISHPCAVTHTEPQPVPVPPRPVTPTVIFTTTSAPSTPNLTVAPITPLAPVTPTSPASFDMFSPPPNLDGLTGAKGAAARAAHAKAKKSKEDKERDKEKRKYKLKIQQEQERQWKMLQQRRQLEQQRQQQQQQQESNIMRQELKRTQQAKGLRISDERKKKSPQKVTKKTLVQEQDQLNKPAGMDLHNDPTMQYSPAVSVSSEDSLREVPPRDSVAASEGLYNEGIMNRNPSTGIPHGLEDMGPLSPATSVDEVAAMVSQSPGQQVSKGAWNEWQGTPSDGRHSGKSPIWSHASVNMTPERQLPQRTQQPTVEQPMEQHSSWTRPLQLATNNHSSTEQVAHQTGDEYPLQNQDQVWKPHPPCPSAHTSVPPSDRMTMERRNSQQDDIIGVSFSHSGSSANLNQGVDSHGLVVQQTLTGAPQQWHETIRSQCTSQDSIPYAPPISSIPQTQGQQPPLLHTDHPESRSYEMLPEWQRHQQPVASGIQPLQSTAMPPVIPQQHVLQPLNEQPQMPGLLQQQPLPQGMPQVPIAPGPPPPPPLPPLTPIQQPQADEQQQQLELLQKQQREQLMRAQQQQFLQMQMQQQQVLQQQQQQQASAAQPTFARARTNPVVNTKDMPEIESEEEHQERLRFLYRQRQMQKQQQMQIQAQVAHQTMFQHPWGAQGFVPGMMQETPTNPPQMIVPQMAQMRAQAPDMIQQQLVMEYQRRMQQRHELGQQSLQYDKVVHEIHQHQSIQPPQNQQTGLMEVSHQRFALRHPTPAMQPPHVTTMMSGQMYGVDGQQLYRMQLQQQHQILMKQPKQIMQQNMASPPVTTLAKEALDEKKTSNAADSHGEIESTSADNSDAKSGAVGETAVCPSKDESDQPEEELKNKQSVKSEENAGGSSVYEQETTVNTETTAAINASTEVHDSIASKESRSPSSAKEGDHSTCSTSEDKPTTYITEHDSISPTEIKVKQEDNVEYEVGQSESGTNASDTRTGAGDGNEFPCNSSESSAFKAPEPHLVYNKDPNAMHAGNTTLTSQEENQLFKSSHKEVEVIECAQHAQGYVEGADSRRTGEGIEQSNQSTGSNTEIGPPSNSSTGQPQPKQQPAQPQIQPFPPKSGASQPGSQQQLMHQQLIVLQQKFFQMQQQRQIMMQQYQQLQQQLQQNPDPMVGAQLMALQQQGQFLQQSLLQVWQHIQIVQQQLQGKPPGMLPPQQPLLSQPSTPPISQGQQPWGPDQQGMVRTGVMAMSGMIPAMSGQPMQRADGIPTPPTKPDKPPRKPRKPRSKSKDSLTPQASPLPGQGPSVDWMPPLNTKPPPKPRGKKAKKQPELEDREMQLQQQRLQQQILQQIEQRHRLIQQQGRDTIISSTAMTTQAMVTPNSQPAVPFLSVGLPASPHMGPPVVQQVGMPMTQSMGPSTPQSMGPSTPLPMGPSTPQHGGLPTPQQIGPITPQQMDMQMRPPSPQSVVPPTQQLGVQQSITPSTSQPMAHIPSSQLVGSPTSKYMVPVSVQQQLGASKPQIGNLAPMSLGPQTTQVIHVPTQQIAPAQQSGPLPTQMGPPPSPCHIPTLRNHQSSRQSMDEVSQPQSQSSPFQHPSEPKSPRTPNPEPFAQRFPTPEHYLQQQVCQRLPIVEYVADANNPFSDDFRVMPVKVKPVKGPKRKRSTKEKKTKVPLPPVPEGHVLTGIPGTISTPRVIDPSISHQPVANEPTLEDAVNAKAADGTHAEPQQSQEEPEVGADGSKGGTYAISDDTSVAGRAASQSEENVSSTPEEIKQTGSSKAVGALQKLESMVADMASEEETCQEQEQGKGEEFDIDLYNEGADQEVANLCSLASLRSPLTEIDGPQCSRQSVSQANSVISLECHEEVPSFISPVHDDGHQEKKADFTSQEASPIPEQSLNMSCLAEKQVNATSHPHIQEATKTDTLSRSINPNESQVINTKEPANTPQTAEVNTSLNDTNTHGPRQVNPQPPECTVNQEPSNKDNIHQPLNQRGEQNQVDQEISHQDPSQQPLIQHHQNQLRQQDAQAPANEALAQLDRQQLSQHGPVKQERHQDQTRDVLRQQGSVNQGSSHRGSEVEGFHEERLQNNVPKQSRLQCPVSPDLVQAQDVPETTPAVLGEPIAMPVESHSPNSDGLIINPLNPNDSRSYSMGQSHPSHPGHGAVMVSGRDPMLAGHSVLLGDNQRSTIANRSLARGASKARTRMKRAPKIEVEKKVDDPEAPTVLDLRKQEYERKRQEFEEQQRKKREAQKELREQKMREKEERKRQRSLGSLNRIKAKENQVQRVRKSEGIDSGNASESSTLSLCEPKLLLTHALMHPYGTSSFNGQCYLKGPFGNANLENNTDYYSKFPSPDLNTVLAKGGIQKPLVNGDLPIEGQTEVIGIENKALLKVRDTNTLKRARYSEHNQQLLREVVSGAVNGLPCEIDVAHKAAEHKQIRALSTDNSVNSSSSSPDTQYIPSSSPESDITNKIQAPNFPALSHRENSDSPTFSPFAASNVKREQLEMFAINSCSGSICPDNIRNDSRTSAKSEPPSTEPSLRLDQGIDDLDNINVTLTLSPSSEMRVSETVASVAELIGCSPPRPSEIIIEPSWKTAAPSPLTQTLKSSQSRTSYSFAVTSPALVDKLQKSPYPYSQFNMESDKKDQQRNKPDGPYCRHCDVLIIGIGVTREPTEHSEFTLKQNENSVKDSSKNGDYKIYSVNVEAGDPRDFFCSDACLEQYYSHLEATSSPGSKQDTKVINRSVSCPATFGQPTDALSAGTVDEEQDVRGESAAAGMPSSAAAKIRRASWKDEDSQGEKDVKIRREMRWKRWQKSDIRKTENKAKQVLGPDEVAELLEKYGVVFKQPDLPEDPRKCTLCWGTGDGETEGTSRLLNLDVDVWIHLNCALWSLEVYETLNGALMNVLLAVKRGINTECCICHNNGATVVCNQVNFYNNIRCSNTYHFGCAIRNNCMFFKDKTMLCHEHKPNEAREDRLPSYAVFRKVFINRDEIQQIASMLRHNQESGGDKLQTLRIGSLVVKSLGQLLLHQLQTFHTRSAVYPVGYKSIRFYWSMHSINKRCQYQCAVEELEGKPSFTVRIHEQGYEDVLFRGKSPKDVWAQVLEPIQKMRREAVQVNLWPEYITGEDLFGLTEQFVLRIIESMPGVDYMQGYNMRYGPSPIMEMPLAVNPTGSARSEPLMKTHFRSTRARALRTTTGGSSSSSSRASAGSSASREPDDTTSLYMKQFVYSKASQYRKLKTEWRHNVFLGRSNIQGLGLFANRVMEPGSMVIEYIGSIIRNEVANRKENIYESQNRGIYMFRIDSDSVIDATIAGGPARYINHSCMPNCVAEVVTCEKEQKIIIISSRKVEKGEELTYDYKFDFEDDEHKISCLCGAPNCRKWMN